MATLRPDFASAEEHLRAIAGQPDVSNIKFIFCGFPDVKRPAKPWQRCATLPDCQIDMCALQAAGYGIFVCINESCNGRRRKDDITGVRAIWADFDKPMLGRYPLPPSMKILTRPARGHAYWMTGRADPIAPDEGEQVNRRIAALHNADLNACDRCRVLRLAGTFNLKGDPFQVRIVTNSGLRYGRSELVRAYPPPILAPQPEVDMAPVKHADRYLAAAINGERDALAKASKGHRNHALNRAAFALGSLGLGTGEVAAALLQVALAVGLSDAEVHRTIKSGTEAGARSPRKIGGLS